ncbi:MAG: NAAT family transporter [Bacteroidales bacterium]|nr:NAAT family transporter [Bacteroidales bacterium]
MNLLLISFAALFSVINPLGTLPIFIGLTKDKHKKEITSVAIWASINTFIILLVSFFLGNYLLDFFGISLNSLRISGGIIIASSGFALLTGGFSKHKGMKKREKDDAYTRSEISLTPLAIPMLAGPGSISLLITYNQENPIYTHKLILVTSILLVCLITFLLLISSRFIVKALGASGINALSRIIGFIVISIGVEFILSTILKIINNII